MHMSSYTNNILAEQCIMSSHKLLEKFNNLLYQNPCLINFLVSNLCPYDKTLEVSHILLILMNCEMYTPYVGFAGILLLRNYVKIKGIPFVIDLSNIFTTTYTN